MGRNLAAVVLAIALIGAVMPVAADEGEIVWGASIPLTGIHAQAGQLANLGMQAYLGYLNATGGINGHPVRLASHDSGSIPEQALAVFKQVMAEEEDVVVFYGDSTDFSLLSAPEVNERYKVLMGGASFATALADPDKFPYQFLAGPTYAEMVGILLEYIAEQGGTDGAAPRVALFYTNLEGGYDPIPYARERAAELGIEIVVEIETEPAGIDVAPEVLKLRRAQPDYVIFQGYVTTVWPEVMCRRRRPASMPCSWARSGPWSR
jgi:branched-chain amino acid transport system substrate-binding protein